MFLLISHGILQKDDPVHATQRLGPHLVALVIFLLVLSFVYKALKNVIGDPHWGLVLGTAVALAACAFLLARVWLNPMRARSDKPFVFVERVFGRLQIITACMVAFAHGANDVANAVGPLAAVVQIQAVGELPARIQVPLWILVLGGIGIVIGLATWGYKVIATIGKKIMELTPTRGFSAEFGAATTVLIASRLGMPVSTTHTLVGAVVGVGLARGLAALNLRVIGKIVNSWLATLPVAAGLSALFFVILRALLT
jgi:PiT family inorganic phosphate transporter